MQLRDFCSFVQGGRLGLTKQDHYRSSGVPAFSAAGQDGYVDVVEFRDTDAVILSAIGANCGRCFLATGNWTTLANVQVIIPRPSDAIAPFLHYRVNRDDYWPRSGSAQPFIKPSDIRLCWVALPPVPQQAAIAKVLDTLDTAIHETEAIIAKLKAVKQGLLHDLLTRGIDANGELRPPQAEAPHLYKPSPLGWIPKEWEAPRLIAVSTRITDGTHQSVKTVADSRGEVPFLFVSCVRDGEIAWDKAASITKRDYVRISKGREPRPGMVLYTAVGSYGQAAEVGDKREFAFQRHIACIYPDATQVVAGFMPVVLNWEPMRRYADRVALGNAQKTITLGELSLYPFVCPTRAEQEEIVRRLGIMQGKLAAELQLMEKLQLQKEGLMDDLLTGRVRVTPLLQEAQHA